MSSLSSVDKILEAFPVQSVEPIIGEPTFETVNGLARVLKQNAASISSLNGGGTFGHLGLVVSAATYATLAPGTPFVEPALPAAIFVPPVGGTAAQISAAERQQQDEQRVYQLYKNTDKALKRLVIGAVEDIYTRPLFHRITGYANVTTLTLLNHLFSNYGQISSADLEENQQRFKKPWSADEPFENLVTQIEDAIDFAEAGGDPISDRQVVTNAYNLVFQTGMFHEACRLWRRKATNTQTWATFKVDFTLAHREHREERGTTPTQAGYQQQANALMEEFVNDTTLSFANLATAASSDRAVIQQLTTTNAELIKSIAAKDAQIAALTLQLAGQQTPTQQRPPPTTTQGRKRFPNLNYCWSHGFDCAEGHDSPSCRFPKEGHQIAATRTNNMGGSQANKNKTR